MVYMINVGKIMLKKYGKVFLLLMNVNVMLQAFQTVQRPWAFTVLDRFWAFLVLKGPQTIENAFETAE